MMTESAASFTKSVTCFPHYKEFISLGRVLVEEEESEQPDWPSGLLCFLLLSLFSESLPVSLPVGAAAPPAGTSIFSSSALQNGF